MSEKQYKDAAKKITDELERLGQYEKAAQTHGLVLMVESNGRCSFFNEHKFTEQMQKTIYRAISKAVKAEIKSEKLEARNKELEARNVANPWICSNCQSEMKHATLSGMCTTCDEIHFGPCESNSILTHTVGKYLVQDNGIVRDKESGVLIGRLDDLIDKNLEILRLKDAILYARDCLVVRNSALAFKKLMDALK